MYEAGEMSDEHQSEDPIQRSEGRPVGQSSAELAYDWRGVREWAAWYAQGDQAKHAAYEAGYRQGHADGRQAEAAARHEWGQWIYAQTHEAEVKE